MFLLYKRISTRPQELRNLLQKLSLSALHIPRRSRTNVLSGTSCTHIHKVPNNIFPYNLLNILPFLSAIRALYAWKNTKTTRENALHVIGSASRLRIHPFHWRWPKGSAILNHLYVKKKFHYIINQKHHYFLHFFSEFLVRIA